MNHNLIILFDISGVLVDLGGMADFKKWTGQSSDAILRRWLSLDSVRNFETGDIGFEDFHKQFVSEWRVELTQQELAESFESSVKHELPGALKLLDELKKKYKLACLTNTNPIQWPIAQETINANKYFEHQFVSHQMGKVKPDAETYEHVIKVLDLPADQIIFFDDSTKNVVAAKEAGIEAHLVKGISGIREILTENGRL